MRLLVDGDSCPADRRGLLIRAGIRIKSVPRFYINNKITLAVRGLTIIRCADADSSILRDSLSGDLIITRDVVLAQRSLARHQIVAIDFCGRVFDVNSIKERLAYRAAVHADALVQLRGAVGSLTACRKAFADALDRIITKHLAREGI